jgi:plasmid maintenance system antidote protein VapI
MAVNDDILRDLEAFDSKPESTGFDLRLDLSEIILRHLCEHGMTQKEVAARSGMKESFITRLIHSEANCTFDTAGRILHALGIRAKLVVQPQSATAATRPTRVPEQSKSADV